MTHAVDSSIESRTTVSDQVPNMVFASSKDPETNVRVQLRPVGHPSPVTQLFEYTLKAWDGQKGDHCTYKYTSSRDSHMEMSATVLVRLPNKPSLLVKDSKFRQSRVLAQNAVANLALQKLSQDDPELKDKLDQMAREVEERKAAALADANAPPPPPPPSRFTTEPHHFHWSSNGAPRGRRPHFAQSHYPGFHHQMAPPQPSPYYAPGPGLHYYQPAPFMPHPLQPSRSTSAPELVAAGAEVLTNEAYPSYDVTTPSGYYHHAPMMDFGGYPQPPLATSGSDSTPSTEAGVSPAAAAGVVDEMSPHPSVVSSMPQWPPHWTTPYYPMPQPPSPHPFYAPTGMMQPPPDYHYFQYMQPDDATAMMMYGAPGALVAGATVPSSQDIVTTDDDDSRQQPSTTALCH